MGTVNDAPCHERYSIALATFSRVLAYGPPGVGKTHAAVGSARERDEEFIARPIFSNRHARKLSGWIVVGKL